MPVLLISVPQTGLSTNSPVCLSRRFTVPTFQEKVSDHSKRRVFRYHEHSPHEAQVDVRSYRREAETGNRKGESNPVKLISFGQGEVRIAENVGRGHDQTHGGQSNLYSH